MNGLVGDADGESFVVTAFEDFDFGGRKKMKILEEIEEAFVALVDTEDCGGIAGAEFGE